jgi:hypothetical protein
MDYAFVIFNAMLSFAVFVPSQTLRNADFPLTLQSSAVLRGVLNPFLRYSYKLFCHSKKVISFRFIIFRTLCAKHPGWGIPCA